MVLMGNEANIKAEIHVARVGRFAIEWAIICQIVNIHLSQQIF